VFTRKATIQKRVEFAPEAAELIRRGVELSGTIAQADRPYGGSLAFGTASRLGTPFHTPSRKRSRLRNASPALVQLPAASG
jgi:hypothetical protein